MNFIAELRRRNVFRMAGLYLVGAWLITQVAGIILPMFGAPDWMARKGSGVMSRRKGISHARLNFRLRTPKRASRLKDCCVCWASSTTAPSGWTARCWLTNTARRICAAKTRTETSFVNGAEPLKHALAR